MALRLVCPFSPESDFSLQPSAQPVRMATAADGEAQPYIPVVDSHLEIVENNINPMLRETFSYKQSDSVAPLQEVTFAAGNVWLAGILFMAGFAAVSVKNEVMEMIAKVRERKGRLDLPIVSGKHLRKIADRTALQSADNVEKFITARKMRYDKEHKDSLSKYPELRKRMQR